MRPTRSSLRHVAAVAMAGTLVTSALMGAPAQAAPASPLARRRRQPRRPPR